MHFYDQQSHTAACPVHIIDSLRELATDLVKVAQLLLYFSHLLRSPGLLSILNASRPVLHTPVLEKLVD